MQHQASSPYEICGLGAILVGFYWIGDRSAVTLLRLFGQDRSHGLYRYLAVAASAISLVLVLAITRATAGLLWAEGGWAEWTSSVATYATGGLSVIIGMVTMAILWAMVGSGKTSICDEDAKRREDPLTVAALLPEKDQEEWQVMPKWVLLGLCYMGIGVGAVGGGLIAGMGRNISFVSKWGDALASLPVWAVAAGGGLLLLILVGFCISVWRMRNQKKTRELHPLLRDKLVVIPKLNTSYGSIRLIGVVIVAAIGACAVGLTLRPGLADLMLMFGIIGFVVINHLVSPIVERVCNKFRDQYGFALSK